MFSPESYPRSASTYESDSHIVHDTTETFHNRGKLLEVLSLPQEKISELRPKLHDVVERALATAINPHDQEALMITADIVSWRLFGGIGDSLPFGLVQGFVEDGPLTISYDKRGGFTHSCLQSGLRALEGAGLDKINTEVYTLMEGRSGEIKAAFDHTLETSQAFSTLHALASNASMQQAGKQPLTPFWHAVRQAQVNEEVRIKWGLEPHAQIIPYTEPDNDLRRKLMKLDDETLETSGREDRDPLARLHSYLSNFVQIEFSKLHPNEMAIRFGEDDDGEQLIFTAQTPKGYDPSDVIKEAACKLAWQINEVGAHVQVITQEWLYYVIDYILWPRERHTSFEDISKDAIGEAWDYIGYDIQSYQVLNRGDYKETGSVESTFHAGLMRPHGSFIKLPQPKGIHDDHKHYSNLSAAYAEINTPTDMPLGEVLHFNRNARGKHAHRILQSEPKSGDFAQVSGNEELIIRLSGQEFQQSQPYIPGYILASNTEDLYGFVPDHMGDPYAPANIPLSSEQRLSLANSYADIGLQKLTRIVENKSHLTVQGLVHLIREHSSYITTAQRRQEKSPFSSSVSIVSMESFRELIQNNTLYVQCSGAAQFLKLSLEAAFGEGAATTTRGYKLARRHLSTSAHHMQTVFTHQGQAYLLDATPDSTEGTSYKDYMFKRKHQFFRPSPQPRLTSLVQASPNPLSKSYTAPARSQEDKIQSVRNSLDIQLMGLFQAPEREALYRKINTLSPDDPFRRTVEVTLRATYGEISRDEAARLYEYLETYSEASDELRHRMGVMSYAPEAIDILKSTIKQLKNNLDSLSERPQ